MHPRSRLLLISRRARRSHSRPGVALVACPCFGQLPLASIAKKERTIAAPRAYRARDQAVNENLYRAIQERVFEIVRRELAGESRRALPAEDDILAAAAAGCAHDRAANENVYRAIQERILEIVRRELAGESRRALPTDADILAAAAAGGESLSTPLRPLALAMRRLAELVVFNEPDADDFHGVLGRSVQSGPPVLTASSAPTEDETWDAVGRLPDKHQLVLLLRWFLGCRLSEVAEALRMPEAATRRLSTQAHCKLRSHLPATSGTHAAWLTRRLMSVLVESRRR